MDFDLDVDRDTVVGKERETGTDGGRATVRQQWRKKYSFLSSFPVQTKRKS